MTTPQPCEREASRRALRGLVSLVLAADPLVLAREAEYLEVTREALTLLRRWFDRYEAALRPRRVQ